MNRYGEPPVDLGVHDPVFDEFCHYLYLPLGGPDFWPSAMPFSHAFPDRLAPLSGLVMAAIDDFQEVLGQPFIPRKGWGWILQDWYVYLTARRGFATPDNPLNRPGWHCDGFGTDDMNYTWCDRYPTRWFDAEIAETVSADHVESMAQFEGYATSYPGDIREVSAGHLYRLNPYVIHAVPEIPAPGGMRTFVKVSFSKHRYNLKGNSHNHRLRYRWEMFDRADIRNDPAYAQGDFYEPS